MSTTTEIAILQHFSDENHSYIINNSSLPPLLLFVSSSLMVSEFLYCHVSVFRNTHGEEYMQIAWKKTIKTKISGVKCAENHLFVGCGRYSW
jgi:hypothetical protein